MYGCMAGGPRPAAERKPTLLVQPEGSDMIMISCAAAAHRVPAFATLP